MNFLLAALGQQQFSGIGSYFNVPSATGDFNFTLKTAAGQSIAYSTGGVLSFNVYVPEGIIGVTFQDTSGAPNTINWQIGIGAFSATPPSIIQLRGGNPLPAIFQGKSCDVTGIYWFDPDSCSKSLAWAGGLLQSETVTDPLTANSYLKTYTYTAGNLTAVTGWVKQ